MKQSITKIFHAVGSLIAGFYLAILHMAVLLMLPTGLILIVVCLSVGFSLNFSNEESPYVLLASLIGFGLFFYHFVWKNGCYVYFKSFGEAWPYKGYRLSTERLIEIGEAGKKATKKD